MEETLIQNITGISIRFPTLGLQEIELFPEKNSEKPSNRRVALIYGPNGSGKSTIAQGFRDYAESVHPASIELCPKGENGFIKLSADAKEDRFFVFDEKYVDQHVKLRKSGLGSIVLFGKQAQLEEEIRKVNEEISGLQKQIGELMTKQDHLEDKKGEDSPSHWIGEIKQILKEKNGWAEIAGKLRGNKNSVTVSDVVIDNIINLKSFDGKGRSIPDEEEARAGFTQLLAIFRSTGSDLQTVGPEIRPISISPDVEKDAEALLAVIPQRPELTQRESALLKLFGFNGITSSKDYLSVPEHAVCPICLREISEEHRKKSLQEISHILNREIEILRQKLRRLEIPEIHPDTYLTYKPVNPTLFDRLSDKIGVLNGQVQKHNRIIEKKIADPLTAIQYDEFDQLTSAYQEVNVVLKELENARISFNQVITDREETRKKLLQLNDILAYYRIRGLYSIYSRQKNALDAIKEELKQLNEQLKQCQKIHTDLDAQRRNFRIALDKINEALAYIFCAKDRLTLELEQGQEQQYRLLSHGQTVPPGKVSSGERNAIGLAYFFTEIAHDREVEELYNKEMFLVIDDPVSSFDMENRIGILSFLRMKLDQVLSSCKTTKVVLMTHDSSVLFDLEKAFLEISQRLCGKWVRDRKDKNAVYTGYRLSHGKTEKLPDNMDEYSQLLKTVYLYARDMPSESDLTIGNVIRRVLEAFSTFSYRKGITALTTDKEILNLLKNKDGSSNEAVKQYIQNYMHRLILNGESHSEERIHGAPEKMFWWNQWSPGEKQRTAKVILCFMYKINERHILSHLSDEKDAAKEIDRWWEEISSW